jgi:hypothetical protein
MKSVLLSGRKVYPAVHGIARWIGPVDGSILDGGIAVLEIEVPRQGRELAPLVQRYWVERLRDEEGLVLGYRLEKWRTPASPETATYDIDVSFGPAPQDHNCNCGDYLSRRRPGGCKHVASLYAALRKIGLAQ